MYALNRITDEERDRIIFGIFARINDQYEKDKSLISPANLVEVIYEDLKADPILEIRKIYDNLGMEGFESFEKVLLTKLGQEKDYKTFSYQYDNIDQSEIYRQWGNFIDKWSYGRLPVSADKKPKHK